MATTGAEVSENATALFVDTNVLVYANVIEAPQHQGLLTRPKTATHSYHEQQPFAITRAAQLAEVGFTPQELEEDDDSESENPMNSSILGRYISIHSCDC